MQVTHIKVSFVREKQPVQYEKAAPAVEFSGTVEEGENPLAAARDLMVVAASVVYATLGYEVPEKVASTLKGLSLGTSTIATEQATATVEVKKGSAKDEIVPEEKPAKKARGRPKGGGKKTSEADVQKLIDAEKAKAAKAQKIIDKLPGDDEIPGEEKDDTAPAPIGPDEIPGDETVSNASETVSNISSGDEDRVDPAQDEGFTPKDLHELILGHVKATPRTLSMDNARAILAHFKVARAGDLTAEQAVEGKVMLDQMVAEEAA